MTRSSQEPTQDGADFNTRQQRLAETAVRYGYAWAVDPEDATTLVIFLHDRFDPHRPRIVAYRTGTTASRSSMRVATVDPQGVKFLTHRQAYTQITERLLS